VNVRSATQLALADADVRVDGGASDRIGTALLGAADLDGDGRDDLLMGAPTHTGADSYEGAVFLLSGGATGTIATDALHTLSGGLAQAQAGSTLALVDLDGDDVLDLAVGAPSATVDDTRAYSGLVALLYGPFHTATALSNADARLLGPDAQGFAGTAVADVGDSDGDTYPNLGVGMPGAELSSSFASAVFLVPTR